MSLTLFHLFQIPRIKSRYDAFQIRIWTGNIARIRHAGLRELADFPILSVGQIPKFDDLAGVKITSSLRIRMKKKLTDDGCVSRVISQ